MAAQNREDGPLRQRCEAVLAERIGTLKGSGLSGINALDDREAAAFRLWCGTWSAMTAYLGLSAFGGPATYYARRGLNARATCLRILGEEDTPRGEDIHQLDSLQQTLLDELQGAADAPLTLSELCEAVDRGPATVREAIDALRAAGYKVRPVKDSGGEEVGAQLVRRCVEEENFHFSGWGEAHQLLGIVSDTHLGSAWCATEALEQVYDWFGAQGVTRVLHAGDLTDGPGASSRHPRHRMEVQDACLLPQGMRDWAVRHYPRREGMETFFVSGQHDDWELRRSGWDLAGQIAERRDDLHHLGYQHADVFLGPEQRTRVRLYHPDGGMAYAMSYRCQKWCEAMPGGDKPHVGVMGHLHQYFAAQIRNVHLLMPGCFQWQTFYLSGKPAWPQVGAVLLELHLDADGSVRRLQHEWLPFLAPVTVPGAA